jgi:hypothetical protein
VRIIRAGAAEKREGRRPISGTVALVGVGGRADVPDVPTLVLHIHLCEWLMIHRNTSTVLSAEPSPSVTRTAVTESELLPQDVRDTLQFFADQPPRPKTSNLAPIQGKFAARRSLFFPISLSRSPHSRSTLFFSLSYATIIWNDV